MSARNRLVAAIMPSTSPSRSVRTRPSWKAATKAASASGSANARRSPTAAAACCCPPVPAGPRRPCGGPASGPSVLCSSLLVFVRWFLKQCHPWVATASEASGAEKVRRRRRLSPTRSRDRRRRFRPHLLCHRWPAHLCSSRSLAWAWHPPGAPSPVEPAMEAAYRAHGWDDELQMARQGQGEQQEIGARLTASYGNAARSARLGAAPAAPAGSAQEMARVAKGGIAALHQLAAQAGAQNNMQHVSSIMLLGSAAVGPRARPVPHFAEAPRPLTALPCKRW